MASTASQREGGKEGGRERSEGERERERGQERERGAGREEEGGRMEGDGREMGGRWEGLYYIVHCVCVADTNSVGK